MKTLWLAALAASALATSAQSQVVADFELNGSTANSIANGVTLTNNGGTLGPTGITFGLNDGPTVSGLGALSAYTIDVGFTSDSLNGPRGNNYVKLIDFSGLSSDAGFYSYFGKLNAYPLDNSANQEFFAGTPVRLTLSRDNTGLITAYIDGSLIYSQSDPNNYSATAITGLNPLTFFTDDRATGGGQGSTGGEASTGFVDYIRIANGALTPGEITPPPAVPEPATWAMMILGMGAVGYAMRRQKAAGQVSYAA